MKTIVTWENRPCDRCALKLGCIHLKGVLDIEPPNSDYWLNNICIPNDLSKEGENNV